MIFYKAYSHHGMQEGCKRAHDSTENSSRSPAESSYCLVSRRKNLKYAPIGSVTFMLFSFALQFIDFKK